LEITFFSPPHIDFRVGKLHLLPNKKCKTVGVALNPRREPPDPDVVPLPPAPLVATASVSAATSPRRRPWRPRLTRR
jgi:hypothetical protein